LVEDFDYRGSYDSIKRYVRKLKKKHKRYSERLPHLPGREAQVDFGKSPCLVRKNGKYKRVWLFKMTLSCSKHAYQELVDSQDLETFLRCQEHAFAHFGGVPEIVTLDNLKSGVLLACLYEPILNATYLAFANHWGFAANPCIPRKPEHKGVVERDIGYTKDNALKARRFESFEEANIFLRHWNRRWAGTRIHGSTKRQVWEMFREVERPLLRPLAEKSFEFFRPGKRKVDVNGLIEVEKRYYAVPPKYVGEYVVVHFNRQWVKVLFDNQVIIQHRRVKDKGHVSMAVSCLPKWKHPDQESQERYYLRQARKAGPHLHNMVYRILSTNNPLAIRRARGILSLLRRYGPEIADAAAAEARRRHVAGYRVVKDLCEKLSEGETVGASAPTLTQQHDLIREKDKASHEMNSIDSQIEKVASIEKEHKKQLDELQQKRNAWKRFTTTSERWHWGFRCPRWRPIWAICIWHKKRWGGPKDIINKRLMPV